MRLLLKLTSEDENYDGPDFALVDLTKEQAVKYLDRIAYVRNATDKPYRISFWDHSPIAYRMDWDHPLANFGEWRILEPGETAPSILHEDSYDDLSIPIEGVILEVDEDGVRWTLYEKHVDVRMMTTEIDKETLEKAATESP